MAVIAMTMIISIRVKPAWSEVGRIACAVAGQGDAVVAGAGNGHGDEQGFVVSRHSRDDAVKVRNWQNLDVRGVAIQVRNIIAVRVGNNRQGKAVVIVDVVERREIGATGLSE